MYHQSGDRGAVATHDFGGGCSGSACRVRQRMYVHARRGVDRPINDERAVACRRAGRGAARPDPDAPLRRIGGDVADRKNALVVRLHDLVCAGTVPLATAQQDVATDWYAAWRRYVVEMSPSPGTPTPSGPSVQLAGPESAESTTTPTSTTGPTSAPPSRGSTPSPTAAPKPAPVPSQPVAAAPAAPAAPEPVTTAAPAPLAPPAAPSTAPATSSSASSSSSATPTGSAARGQPCAPVGATGQTANGRTLVCATTGQWRLPGG